MSGYTQGRLFFDFSGCYRSGRFTASVDTQNEDSPVAIVSGQFAQGEQGLGDNGIDEANAARLALSWNSHDELVAALQACDTYWRACAKAWAAGDGKVINEDGHTIVEAEGLDELADAAGDATRAALANLKEAQA